MERLLTSVFLGSPDDSAGKESACTAGDSGFDSWVGKIHWRRDRLPTPVFLGLPCGSDGKESAWNVGYLGLISGLGRSPGEGNCYPVQYSGMENSMELVHGVAKSWTRLSDFHFYFLCLSHSLLPKILTIAFNKICSLVLRNDRGWKLHTL